ncbi:hypothetical protein E2R58_12955 [Paenibacillus amylolyticus]|uniref:hypothetical protein n=1 Tax=Paenibacillus amylolyticus TaxID=1451 RepID=UPI001059D773|nr:hypothetical protein [Paenibacillus amylolyticus]TDL70025.1 hypothetical protein E2R58_12955 [Paenibacillus amylolyticus]
MNIGGIGYPGSIMRNKGSKPKSSSALDTNSIAPKFDTAAHSSANNYVSTFAQAALKNASQEVQDAWNKAEEKKQWLQSLIQSGLMDTDLILDQAQGYTSLRLFSYTICFPTTIKLVEAAN